MNIEFPSTSETRFSEPAAPEPIQFMEVGPVHWRVALRAPAWRPPTDVYETDDAIVVRVEIAGMREEDFVIQIDDRFLSIRGTRADAPERRAFYQMEIRYGEFSIELELPVLVSAIDVKALYRDGFLWVTLPKAQSRRVMVGE